MDRNAPVTPIIPVYDPNPEYLARTLDSIGKQSQPVEEVVIMDSSPVPLDAESDEVPVRVVHVPEAGIGEARRQGMQQASTDLVSHMDEDAVLLDSDYFSRAVGELQDPDVAGVGGTVFPIEGNPFGRGIALADRFNPTSLGTHHLVHDRRLCGDGKCVRPGMDRGEDATIRQQLQSVGELRRMDDQAALKDLPTTRQERGGEIMTAVLSAIVSSVASAAVAETL
jgi:Glycosyltransferases, probably involved in cell wall biogenesis